MLSKRIISGLLISGVSLLLSLALSEAAVRLLSTVSDQINYLARAGTASESSLIRTFEEFRRARGPLLKSHRDWRNYRTNEFGFNDTEFEMPKPPGRFRIIALGDSFTFSATPYPATAMTLLEKSLRTYCRSDIEVLNLGVSGAGVEDYRRLFNVLGSKLQPDMVMVNLYLGNDGPDTFHGRDDLPRPGPRLALFTLLRNLWRLYRGMGTPLPGNEESLPPADARGGQRIHRAPDMTDRDPQLQVPTFVGDAWVRVMRDELLRFYRFDYRGPSNPGPWQRVLSALEALKDEVHRIGAKFTIVAYPSRLQLYPNERREALKAFNRRLGGAPLRAENFDVTLSGAVVSDFCRAHSIPCFDLLPHFQKVLSRMKQPLYLPQDTHWNILGNRVAATGQARNLRALVCPKAGTSTVEH